MALNVRNAKRNKGQVLPGFTKKWPVVAGMAGQLRPESVASYDWNRWPVMTGFCIMALTLILT